MTHWNMTKPKTLSAQHHDAEDRNRDRDEHRRQRQSDSSNRVVALDQNFEEPNAVSSKRPQRGGRAEAVLGSCRTGGNGTILI